MTDFDTMTITIDDRLNPNRKREVLLHELLHCIIWAFGIDVPVLPRADDENKHGDEEEKFIQQVTNPLMLVIQSNSTIFKWIQEKEKNHGS